MINNHHEQNGVYTPRSWISDEKQPSKGTLLNHPPGNSSSEPQPRSPPIIGDKSWHRFYSTHLRATVREDNNNSVALPHPWEGRDYAGR